MLYLLNFRCYSIHTNPFLWKFFKGIFHRDSWKQNTYWDFKNIKYSDFLINYEFCLGSNYQKSFLNVRGPNIFCCLNLLHKLDVVQGSATRYCEPTVFVNLSPKCHCDVCIAIFQCFLLCVSKCVWWFFVKLKWLILKNECMWNFVSFWKDYS